MQYYVQRFSSAALLSFVLSACGGGGGESTGQDVATVAIQNQAVISQQSLSDEQVSQSDCQLTILDEKVLEAVNTARSEARFCGDNFYEAVDPVSWSCTLKRAAQGHSEDMGENNFFSHTGSDGLRVSHRVDDVDYDWMMVGENIAAGFNSAGAVVNGWLNSPGHCATVMNPAYTETATALHLPLGSDYSTYWTMIMAKPL